MLTDLLSWFDDRTGYKRLLHEALYEQIPGGAKWRYVWGSTLVFAFATQLITGVFLWMHYSPSTQTAWESVYYIEHELTGGWLLRGIHHFMAQAMIVLMALHLMQVVVAGAYRAPREINFWLGLLLMLTTFGLGLTGYLLPWDQKGYWATQVATKIAGASPVIGDQLKALAVGGAEYGHHTLTRFFALHAGVLPGAMMGLIGLHLAMFRKYGVTHNAATDARHEDFWPGQVLKDGVACLAVLLTVCGLSYWMGAELGPPADPAQAYNAARPEWYYLFLFQLLKVVDHVAPGEAGIVLGAHIIPALVFGLIALMPILGRWNLGHRFNVFFLGLLMLVCGWLTFQAIQDDNYANWYAYDAEKFDEGSDEREAYDDHFAKSRDFLAAKELAHAEGERARVLAAQGIPPAGMLGAFRADTKVAGYRLFKQHCAVCHSHHERHSGEGGGEHHADALRTVVNEKPNAANLFNFGSRDWMARMLDAEQLASVDNFGATIHADTDMINWVRDNQEEYGEYFDAIGAAISAQAALPYQQEQDAADVGLIAEGMGYAIDTVSCVDCHKLGDEGDLGSAPDLTGYASREWLVAFIENPQSERFYDPANYDESDHARMMPAFAGKLSRSEIETIADWLRGDWYEPPTESEGAESDDGEPETPAPEAAEAEAAE